MPTKKIENPNQLKVVLQEIGTKAIEKVTTDLHGVLLKYVDKYVYNYEYKPPNAMYHKDHNRMPTFEFRDAWKISDTAVTNTYITKNIFYKWQDMSNDPDTWLHGSNVKGWPQDVREFLPAILDVTGPTSNLMAGSGRFFSKMRGSFYTEWLYLLFVENDIQKRFDRELKKYKIIRK